MPANLPPTYHAAEERLRAASSSEEKLEILREMLALIPKHKGTDKLQADLKRRISKLQNQAQQQGGAKRTTFDHVSREGAGQVVLIGPPNAGKSALMAALTHARPKIAPYPFTTRVPQPGMMPYEDIQIQLVDTPAMSADFTEPWLPGLVRAADLCLLVVNPVDAELLDQVEFILGRLPRSRVRLVNAVQEGVTTGAGATEIGVRTLVIGSHGDLEDAEVGRQLLADLLGGRFPIMSISSTGGAGLEELRRRLFELLRVIRVYTKEPGKEPDRARPFVMQVGGTVMDLAVMIHKDVGRNLSFARVWGEVKFAGQTVERKHRLADGDVVELHS